LVFLSTSEDDEDDKDTSALDGNFCMEELAAPLGRNEDQKDGVCSGTYVTTNMSVMSP